MKDSANIIDGKILSSKKFLDYFKVIIAVSLIVLLVSSIDYFIAKHLFDPALRYDYFKTFISLVIMLESAILIVVGFNFMRERVEQHREGYEGNIFIPDMVYIPSLEVIRKRRPMLGLTLIGAGIILLILSFFLFLGWS